jgi:hypothetical protein
MALRPKSIAISILAAFLLCLTASAQSEDIRVGSLTLKVPANWYQAPIPSDERYTRAVLASDSDAKNQALMMVSVVPRNGRTLEAMNAATRTFVATKMDGVLEYEKSSTVDGAPAHMFVYEGRSEHSSQGRRKFMRVILQKGNSFYILHGVADHIPFANYAGTMENMVNSVRWTN